MASPIVISAPVNAPAAKIFEAITRSTGLASFWVGDSQAVPAVGSVTRLNLPSGKPLELRVDELEPGRRVAWTALSTIARPPRWTGTTVTWDLSEADRGGTEVLVEHGNWPADMLQRDLAPVTFLWAQVLRSLKAYVETGESKPIIPAATRSTAETGRS